MRRNRLLHKLLISLSRLDREVKKMDGRFGVIVSIALLFLLLFTHYIINTPKWVVVVGALLPFGAGLYYFRSLYPFNYRRVLLFTRLRRFANIALLLTPGVIIYLIGTYDKVSTGNPIDVPDAYVIVVKPDLSGTPIDQSSTSVVESLQKTRRVLGISTLLVFAILAVVVVRIVKIKQVKAIQKTAIYLSTLGIGTLLILEFSMQFNADVTVNFSGEINPEITTEIHNHCDTVPASGFSETMDSLLTIGPFLPGTTQFADDTSATLQLEQLRKILSDNNYRTVYVQGSVDKRPLRPAVQRIYGDNLTLAQARADTIAGIIRSHSVKKLQVITLPAGGKYYGTDEAALSSDRVVTVYGNGQKR